MTTIKFQENISIKRFEFKDILDFKNYLDKNFYFTRLMELDENEATLKIREKMRKTKQLDSSHFVNI